MAACTNAIGDDDDDDLAKLMPNTAKLIRSGESDSLVSSISMFTYLLELLSLTSPHANPMIPMTFICLQESKGSTSMSLGGNSGKDNIERQSPKPSVQRRGETVFRDVANKFLRRGATGKRFVVASKSSALTTLSSNRRCTNPALNTPSKFRIVRLPITTY